MDTKVLVLICILLTIVSISLSIYCLLFHNENETMDNPSTQLIDDVTNDNQSKNEIANSLFGTYRVDWNGHERVLVLFEDMTYVYPTGLKGTWYLEYEKVVLEYEGYKDASMTEMETKQMILDIVDKGLLYGNVFFEKI